MIRSMMPGMSAELCWSDRMEYWNIQRTTFSVADFLGWMRAKELELSPSFQRRPVWKPKAKSYFIDTITRGLPVPIIFLRERIDIETARSVREVVDGQQRLRTVISFIEPQLLPDFREDRDVFFVLPAHNKTLAGKHYGDFPSDIKKRILGYQFSVDTLPRNTDDADVLQIFKRINSTSQSLNYQELRNAEYFGYFAQSVYSVALEQLDRWRRWRLFSEDELARMEEVELSSEVYILMVQGIFAKTKSTVDRYYKIYDDEFPQREVCEDRFRRLFDAMEESIGQLIPKLSLRRKAIFFNLISLFYDLMYDIGSELRPLKPRSLPRGLPERIMRLDQRIRTGEVPEAVSEALARRTTHVGSRRTVINFLKTSVTLEQAA